MKASIVVVLFFYLSSAVAQDNQQPRTQLKYLLESTTIVPLSPQSPVIIGQGYNSLSDTFRGFPLDSKAASDLAMEQLENELVLKDGDQPAEDDGKSEYKERPQYGQTLQYDMEFLKTATELRRFLNVKVALSSSFAVGKVNARADILREHTRNANSSYLVIKVVVRNSVYSISDCKLSNNAIQLLKNAEQREFFNTYGDEFVVGLTTGGEFLAIAEIQHENTTSREMFSASMKGKLYSFKMDASIATEFSSKLGTTSIKVSLFKAGGTSDLAFGKTDLDGAAKGFDSVMVDLLAMAKKVPTDVKLRPVLISATTSDYNVCSNLPKNVRAPTFNYTRPVLDNYFAVRDKALSVSQNSGSADPSIGRLRYTILKVIADPFSVETEQRRYWLYKDTDTAPVMNKEIDSMESSLDKKIESFDIPQTR